MNYEEMYKKLGKCSICGTVLPTVKLENGKCKNPNLCRYYASGSIWSEEARSYGKCGIPGPK